MGVGDIGTNNKQAISAVEVLITARHRVHAEAGFVARYRRRHAEPRVGVDMIGADKAFGQFVDDIIVLRR